MDYNGPCLRASGQVGRIRLTIRLDDKKIQTTHARFMTTLFIQYIRARALDYNVYYS